MSLFTHDDIAQLMPLFTQAIYMPQATVYIP